MSVDYLSTLNKNGSGLNITQIVDSIVEAEVERRLEAVDLLRVFERTGGPGTEVVARVVRGELEVAVAVEGRV